MTRNPVKDLRLVGLAEGVSFLLLLAVAVPLKYLADDPLAVRVVGPIHGGLFVLYVVAAVRAARRRRWPIDQAVETVAAALLPLGPFLIDGRLRREQALAEAAPEAATEGPTS